MRGLPLLGRSLDEPVCWNLFHCREVVLWLTLRVRATSFCDCPAWRRPITIFRVAGPTLAWQNFNLMIKAKLQTWFFYTL
jgi:hypothetical protein